MISNEKGLHKQRETVGPPISSGNAPGGIFSVRCVSLVLQLKCSKCRSLEVQQPLVTPSDRNSYAPSSTTESSPITEVNAREKEATEEFKSLKTKEHAIYIYIM